jgi:hypothetical protein
MTLSSKSITLSKLVSSFTGFPSSISCNTVERVVCALNGIRNFVITKSIVVVVHHQVVVHVVIAALWKIQTAQLDVLRPVLVFALVCC